MTLDEIPSELKECLACISTLSSLGIPADKCQLLITKIKDFEGYYYVIQADLVVGGEESTFSCALVPCEGNPDNALALWEQATEAWNTATVTEREVVWRETSYFRNEITVTVQTLLEMGFDFTIGGITYRNEDISHFASPEEEQLTSWN